MKYNSTHRFYRRKEDIIYYNNTIGWAKAHRKMLLNPVVTKNVTNYAVWNYLIQNAEYTETLRIINGREIVLRPGQLITGRAEIARDLNGDESAVRRALDDFEINRMIDRQRFSKFSLISLINWEKYQTVDQQNGRESAGNSAESQPENDPQTAPVIYIKNKKKDRSQEVYSLDDEVDKAIHDYIYFREELHKPMTDRAIHLMLNKLESLSDKPEEQVEIINQSIVGGYCTLYPLQEPRSEQNRPINRKAQELEEFYAMSKKWAEESDDNDNSFGFPSFGSVGNSG